MKTKMLALILALCCLVGLSSCNQNPTGSQSPGNSSTAPSNSNPSGNPSGNTPSGGTSDPVPQVKYPSGNTLNLIIPVKAGGNMDVLGRALADYLDDAMGVNVVVQNLVGSGGVVAATQYLAEKPNTDTIIFLPANIFTVSPLYNDLEFTINDYAPIAAYNSESNGVFALADGPIKSFEDLKNWDTNKTLLFGSGGQGVANYLMQAALYKDLGLKAETIPHGSAAEGLVNVIAGTTNVTLASLTLAEQYVKDGSLIPLFTYEKEEYTYADGTKVPSLQQLTGKDYDIPSLQFFAIRAGTDEAVVKYLYDKFQEVYSNPDFQADYVAKGGNLDNLTGLATTPSSDVAAMIANNVTVARELFEKTEN